MSAAIRVAAEFGLAAAALLCAAASCSRVRSVIDVAPIADGQPVTTSVIYDPPTLLLSLTLATAAGVLAVVGTTRLRRLRRCRPVAASDDSTTPRRYP